jgi:hypothetical protein
MILNARQKEVFSQPGWYRPFYLLAILIFKDICYSSIHLSALHHSKVNNQRDHQEGSGAMGKLRGLFTRQV